MTHQLMACKRDTAFAMESSCGGSSALLRNAWMLSSALPQPGARPSCFACYKDSSMFSGVRIKTIGSNVDTVSVKADRANKHILEIT